MQFSPTGARRVKTDLQTSQLNLFTRQSCRTTTTTSTTTATALPVPKSSPNANKKKTTTTAAAIESNCSSSNSNEISIVVQQPIVDSSVSPSKRFLQIMLFFNY